MSQLVKFLRKAAALLLLPLLAWSCQLVTDDYDVELTPDSPTTPQYINVTISVSAGNTPLTRAPKGGEYGDNTEKGIVREYAVDNITLILYQDETGINTSSDDAEVVFVKKYDVHELGAQELPTTHTHKDSEPDLARAEEVLYTTGNQRIDGTSLQAGNTYKVLVIANANVDVRPGQKIKDIRDNVFTTLYTGTGLGTDASHFVMTSETETTVTLADPAIDTSNGVAKRIYYFGCIHIERLAARIDYCTRGARDNAYDETYGGFVYVEGRDLFVVTKVTPFNLYQEPEYAFKRVRDLWNLAPNAPTPVINYLGDETTVNNVASNYVVDPHTVDKITIPGNPPANITYNTSISYSNRLGDMLTAAGTNPYTQVMADVHETSSYVDENNFNNIIIAYPRENTLLPTSLCKWYATGLIFEVDVYRRFNDANPPGKETKRYYHYLRHQGEHQNNQSYKTEELKAERFQPDVTTCGNVPMKCGIVRDNIYRVSVSGVQDGRIIVTIEEEKWRHVDNPVIYI